MWRMKQMKDGMKENRRYMDTQALATKLGICPQTVIRMARCDLIPHIRVGKRKRQYRFELDKVESALNGSR
jgi:hypothetical protein